MLIKNHIETWVWKSTEMLKFTVKILKNHHKNMHTEHQNLATMLKIFQMPITFLRIIWLMQTWFSYAKWQKTGRKETIKMENQKEKENSFFLFYSQETSCLKNYLKVEPQLFL